MRNAKPLCLVYKNIPDLYNLLKEIMVFPQGSFEPFYIYVVSHF